MIPRLINKRKEVFYYEKVWKYLTAAILAVSMAVTPITSYGFGWSKTEAAEEKEESYAFKTGDTVITMGAEAAPILKALGKVKSTFEQDSCAYQGKSRIYTYDNFELGTSTASGKECVESIYIAGTSGTAATQEGVQTGSKKEDVIKAYGKDYKEDFGNPPLYPWKLPAFLLYDQWSGGRH